MREFTSTREYPLMPEEMSSTLRGILGEYPDHGEHKFGILLGGSVFLLETQEDFKKVEGYSSVIGARYANVTEEVLLADGGEIVGNYGYVFFCNNNGGGPSYWCHKDIMITNFLKTIDASN